MLSNILLPFLFLNVLQKCTGVRVTLNPDGNNVEKSVKLGIRTVLECFINFENTPGVDEDPVHWFYTQDMDPASTNLGKALETSTSDDFILQPPYSLVINDPKKGDYGKYTCHALFTKDTESIAFKSYMVTVVYKPSKPICQHPSDGYLTRGYEAELKCQSAEGKPDPEYTWFKDGAPLPENSAKDARYKNQTFTVDKNTGTLKFLEVSDANVGKYYCRARNSEGEETCQPFNIYVQDVNAGRIAGIVIGIILAICVVAIVIFLLWRKGVCTGGSGKDEDYMYDMADEGNNDVMLDVETPHHVTKNPSDVGSNRPESSMMI